MRVIVYGVQNLDFTTADGVVIRGKSIYCGFENKFVNGLKTNKFFIPSTYEVCKDIEPDSELDITFDYNGRIDNVTMY